MTKPDYSEVKERIADDYLFSGRYKESQYHLPSACIKEILHSAGRDEGSPESMQKLINTILS